MTFRARPSVIPNLPSVIPSALSVIPSGARNLPPSLQRKGVRGMPCQSLNCDVNDWNDGL